MKDPIILWPRITPEEVWKECKEWVNEKGGLSSDNPHQMMAAAGADPGVCSCPNCREYHWAYGQIHQCHTCKFIYPTDWWPMYSYGCSAGHRGDTGFRHINDMRKNHPYWKYGFENPNVDPWKEKESVRWIDVIGNCYIYGGEFSESKDLKDMINSAQPLNPQDKEV